MISASTYVAIANLLGEMRPAAVEAQVHLDTAGDWALKINSASGTESRTRLVAQMDVAANTIGRHLVTNPPKEVRRMIVALNDLVVATGVSVNTFLAAGGLRVTPAFADLSAQCGYTISAGNIEVS